MKTTIYIIESFDEIFHLFQGKDNRGTEDTFPYLERRNNILVLDLKEMSLKLQGVDENKFRFHLSKNDVHDAIIHAFSQCGIDLVIVK